MKILFLDIDGVLNSVRSAVAYEGYPKPSDLLELDDIAINLIKKVCIKTNSFICLSSTWRYSIKDIIAFAKEIDLPIIAKTPYKLSSNRGEEIQMWLDKNKVEKYAIVDDDSDMLKEQLPLFVKVDGKNGLSYENYEALLKLLT